MKVLMAAPFEVKGRYQGGISSIANAIMAQADYWADNNLEIVKYETCCVERSANSDEQLSTSNLKNSVEIYSSLWREVKTVNPRILYFHSSVRLALLKDLIAIRHAKKKTGVKTIVHIHFAEYEKIMTGKKLVDHIILDILKKYIDKVIFLSKGTADEFINHGLEKSKTSVVYNFSTVEYTSEEQEYAIKSEDKTCKFLFVGSIDRRKGICDILDCLKQIQEPYEFHICGGYRDDSVKLEVKNAMRQLGLSIIEHGYVSGDEKKNIYLKSDVLVLPSYGEGLPMVIMEAYHAGCAVISTAVGAIPEVVGKDNGFVIEPGNKEQLLDAMKILINNHQLLQSMKRENVQEAEKFTLKKFVNNVASVCKEFV